MKQFFLLAITLLISKVSSATSAVNYNERLKEALPGFEMPSQWLQTHPAFRVIGNLYGVGGVDLASYLITSDDGHILINTGIEGSLKDIEKNITTLGFDIADVKILLSMQSHFDHTADLALIREITGAKMYATKKDARVLEDGGLSDPHFGGLETFRPVTVDKIVEDGEIIELGEIRLKVYYHPGHTEGSSSYGMQVVENGKTYNVLISNMGTINPGKKLLVDPTYPGVSEDFAHTYRSQKQIGADIWVAAHKSQYGFYFKYKASQPYSPETFFDPKGFLAAVEKLEAAYTRQLEKESAELDGTNKLPNRREN